MYDFIFIYRDRNLILAKIKLIVVASVAFSSDLPEYIRVLVTVKVFFQFILKLSQIFVRSMKLKLERNDDNGLSAEALQDFSLGLVSMRAIKLQRN